MSPSQVTQENSTQVLLNIRKTHPVNHSKQKPFKVDDKVRIARAKGIFEKGATSNFSEEIFTINKVKKTPQGYVYRLKDYDGEDITSIFYHYELAKANETKNSLTKFTNRLQHAIALDGDWVVGIQEIFYPIDLTQGSSDVTFNIIGGGPSSYWITITEADDVQKFVNKFNAKVSKIFDKLKSDLQKSKNANRVQGMQSDQAPQTEQVLSPEGFEFVVHGIVNNQTYDIFTKELYLNNLYALHKKERNPKELPVDVKRLSIEAKLINDNLEYTDEKKEELITKLYERVGKTRMSEEMFLAEEKEIIKNPDLSEDAKDRKLEELYTSQGRAPPPKRARKDPDVAKWFKQFNAKRRELSEKNKELKRKNEELASKQTEINDLFDKFTTAERKLNTKLDEIKELNKSIQSFENEKTQLNKARDDLSREKQALEREKVELMKRLNKADDEIKTKKEEISRLTTEANKVNPLERQLAEAKRKYDDLKTEKTGIDQALFKAEKELNTKKEEIRRLTTAETERKYGSLKTEKEGLERKIAETERNLSTCNSKVADLDAKKAKIEALERDITGKDQQMRDKQIEVNNLTAELTKVKQALDESQNNLNVTKDEYTKEINKLKVELGLQAENTTDEVTSDKPPRLEYSKGVISMIRGWLGNIKLIPKFNDAAFINALGFIDDPSEQLITNPKVTASRPADLNARSSLMFVYSDIVAPHFVGDTFTRVLRILPLKRGQRHEIVHERFVKPFYYPVRTNQIEDVNFILTDETGNPIKFASGRVAIGLHLKRFV
ncbi:paramyosin-like [Tetranychus urticae]|uniref:paramyosin-like n=1 Tax=Tetranychus urticae TaxID=32264 RepID=UPI00077BDE3B|nr:paramyosin-like [Tetranychus urticae]